MVASPPAHDLWSRKRLRRDIEALLRTYDEVEQVWPQETGCLWVRLRDRREFYINITDFPNAPGDPT